jgi:hypothetical protein
MASPWLPKRWNDNENGNGYVRLESSSVSLKHFTNYNRLLAEQSLSIYMCRFKHIKHHPHLLLYGLLQLLVLQSAYGRRAIPSRRHG